jgi:hypothetical protein
LSLAIEIKGINVVSKNAIKELFRYSSNFIIRGIVAGERLAWSASAMPVLLHQRVSCFRELRPIIQDVLAQAKSCLWLLNHD